MTILEVETNVCINDDSSPSSSSTSSCPSPVIHLDTIPLSRQSSQTDTLDTASTTSLPTPTVKFAPLPALGPRKRKSNQPLGMAARAQLVSNRHARRGQKGDLVVPPSPMWSRSELAEQRKRIEVMAARHAEFQARENAQEVSRHCDQIEDERPERSDLSEVGNEDPILVIGKIVKVAGKSLWSRVSGSKSEASLRISQDRQERRRDLSPLPILIHPLPPVRTAYPDARKGPTRHQTEQNDQDAVDPETVEPGRPSDEEIPPAVTSSASPD